LGWLTQTSGTGVFIMKSSGEIGRRMLYKTGELIFSEGQSGREMYIVESGSVRIFLTAKNREMTLAILKRGDFFGEMALLEDLPRSAGATALEELCLIAIEKEDFKYLIREHPEIAMKVLSRFSRRLRDADSLINLLLLGEHTGLVIADLLKRIMFQNGSDYLNRNECNISVTFEDISRETGIDINHVRQIMRELEKYGLAYQTDDGIVVRRYEKLKTYQEYFNWRQSGEF
jgi:CRP/FNR family transcriptional regulator, cyclic AMP receptor protein